MEITPYQAVYFAHELTRKGATGIDRLSRSLFDACVDLNPHQIDAALFALRSPLSKGVLLADEVGLGKTIEAGIAICQSWAEKHRRILVVCPASIRKQWALELWEKFHLPTLILDSKTYRMQRKGGNPAPFDSDKVVICSLHYASKLAAEIKPIQWDLVVIDEAHKLRNAFRPSNRMGQNIRFALEDRRKILLTATPLQNSLLELYGLSTVIDDHIFGDANSFRARYTNAGGDLAGLRDRLRSFCTRTLRSQVSEYIQYTERIPLTRPFSPTDQEHKLYEAVSEFLQREDTYALPYRQRHLTALIVRKLLASSSQALAGTMEVMKDRLLALRSGLPPEEGLAQQLLDDLEIEDDIVDEILDESEDWDDEEPEDAPKIDRKKLDAEIEELTRFANWARSIGIDTKTRALLTALGTGFEQMLKLGAQQKAVVFTESRRTQQFLKDFLESNGYLGKVFTFNGSNNEPDTTKIYERWLSSNTVSGRISGSRPIDVRQALIEHFQNSASIMLATEAAAEGINLQFCSLVINYDLPWNPQRIEQRIGRCHRYGQKYDVVVINFLNERNDADRRVLELLEEKFQLFSGVFGASDDVLGSIESGLDFERRILDIYQKCRTTKEIEAAFNALRQELQDSITQRMKETEQKLLEHFDEDVHERLKVNLTGAKEQIGRFGRMFWALTSYMLAQNASFNDTEYTFDLHTPPAMEFRRGLYRMVSKERENIPGDFLYRLGHPLGEHVVATGMLCKTPKAKVTFNISDHPTRIALVEELLGRSGWLILQKLRIESFDSEEHLLFSAFDDDGKAIDQEACVKLFNCTARVDELLEIGESEPGKLHANADRHAQATVSMALERNNELFREERERLDRWAEDSVLSAEKELSDIKEQIKVQSRMARQAPTLDEQYAIQERIKELEKKKRAQRNRVFEVEDEITEKRDKLIQGLERRMQQQTETVPLFVIRWSVI